VPWHSECIAGTGDTDTDTYSRLNWRQIRKGRGYNEGEALPSDDNRVGTSFSQGRSLGHVTSGIVFDGKWEVRSELPVNLPVVDGQRDDGNCMDDNLQHTVSGVVESEDDSVSGPDDRVKNKAIDTDRLFMLDSPNLIQ